MKPIAQARASRLCIAMAMAMALSGQTMSLTAMAQQMPDAGQLLQEQRQVPKLPNSSAPIAIQPQAATPTTSGGTEVPLSMVRITGASVFTEMELAAVLGEVAGKTYDLAGLRALAERVTAHYHDNGYPFARAYLPPQPIAEGQLRIEVVEGRYSKIQTVTKDPQLQKASQSMMDHLAVGSIIQSDVLERVTLLLDDVPGLKITPIIRPGQEVGTGELNIFLEREPGQSGDAGVDNHGNRFTGEYRARVNMQWDSPFTFGDQISVRSLYSDEDMWLGSLGYSLPLGSSGLRGNVGYSHTYYELAKNFANLGATGTAKVASLGVTYPLIRSQKANLNLAVTYQHKKLNDKQRSANTDDSKSSDSLPISLNFDRRDGLWGGGISYGSLAYTTGRLKLGSVLENTDRTSGQNTRGSFDKWNLDIARVQATPVANLTLFGRVSTQWAAQNLDSSEGFSLGGANGVRGYPSGEGNGDEGWMAQLEIRYAMGAFNPYAFHDSGRVKINADPGSLAVAPNPNHRSIGSFGVGTRYTAGDINVDASLAWRSHGGQPQSDTADRTPRAWVTVGYKF